MNGHEALALQAVLVEIVGLAVGRGDHGEALVEQHLEQARQDHGVGDVGDLELVEAEQPRLARDLLGDRHDGVGLGRRALGRQLLAAAVQALLDFQHELVEMHAPLPGHRHVGEEQVHQHRLAAADRSPDVKPARARRRLGGGREAKAGKKAGLGRGMIGHRHELLVDRLQLLDDLFLHGIGVDLAGVAAGGEIGRGAFAGRRRGAGGRG